MFLLAILTLLLTSISASPLQDSAIARYGHGQGIVLTANELESGPCRQITFIYARGSGEPGNMGDDMGPGICNALKEHHGSTAVACQGVGDPYTAGLLDNFDPDGTSHAAIAEAKRLFVKAHTKCPDTITTAGGYSQGAAVMTGAISALSDPVRGQVAGTVLFGDTRNEQTHGVILHYEKKDLLVICNHGDLLCEGLLIPTPPHYKYLAKVPQAVKFLEGRIDGAKV